MKRIEPSLIQLLCGMFVAAGIGFQTAHLLNFPLWDRPENAYLSPQKQAWHQYYDCLVNERFWKKAGDNDFVYRWSELRIKLKPFCTTDAPAGRLEELYVERCRIEEDEPPMTPEWAKLIETAQLEVNGELGFNSETGEYE